MTHMTETGMVVRHTLCRATGSTITVERTGPGSWIEQKPGWVTLCLNHSTLCLHRSRHAAERHAAWPEWCGDCARILTGEKPRITTGKIL